MPRPIDQSRAIAAKLPVQYADPIVPFPNRDGFVSRLTIPVSSDRLGQPPSRETRESVERSNAGVLGFLLQEVDLEAMPRPAEERLATALAPLRIKLDMLIEMVARLSYRDVAMPPVATVELGPAYIGWHSREPLQCGDWLRLDLFFHPIFREPICLLAAVTNCVEQNRDEGCRVEANVVEMLDSTRERLARLAFLTQRQQQTLQRPAVTPRV